MNQYTSYQTALLSILGDGSCHHDSRLGQALNLTPRALWKHIKQLIDLGIPIQKIPQQGYQLASKHILLNAQQIKETILAKGLSTSFNLHLFTSIDSTNRFLKDLPITNQLDVCCAEMQTQGRGRFGRQWHSPFGENIYCSSRWNLNCGPGKLSGLSMVTSLAIVATLQELKQLPDIKIKWPNDIYWTNKKLCGSLIEILTATNNITQVIIGIGLNVNTDTENHPLPDKPWCSLYEITKSSMDRNLITAGLISNLEHYLKKFINNDLTVFMDEWNQYDYLAGKYIKIIQSNQIVAGKACGINHLGQLVLEDEYGLKHLLSSGDTSLHEN